MKKVKMLAMGIMVVVTSLVSCSEDKAVENLVDETTKLSVADPDQLTEEEKVGMPAEYEGMTRTQLLAIRDKKREDKLDAIGQMIKDGNASFSKKVTLSSHRSSGSTFKFDITGPGNEADADLDALFTGFGEVDHFTIVNKSTSNAQIDVRVYVYLSPSGKRERIAKWLDIDPGETMTKQAGKLSGNDPYNHKVAYVLVENDAWWWQTKRRVTGSVTVN